MGTGKARGGGRGEGAERGGVPELSKEGQFPGEDGLIAAFYYLL